MNYNYTVTQTGRTAELYIDRGRGADEENRALFDQLCQHRDAVEASFGGALSWEALEGKRACRIRAALNDGGYRSAEDLWDQLQAAQIDAMIRLERALKSHVRGLRA